MQYFAVENSFFLLSNLTFYFQYSHFKEIYTLFYFFAWQIWQCIISIFSWALPIPGLRNKNAVYWK